MRYVKVKKSRSQVKMLRNKEKSENKEKGGKIISGVYYGTNQSQEEERDTAESENQG